MTQETNTNVLGPYFYAKEAGELTHRSAVRFDRLFEPHRKPEFAEATQKQEYAEIIKWLLLACKDQQLERGNMTRSQIVMAYNKDQAKLKSIQKFITEHGVFGFFDKVIASGIGNFDIAQSNPRFARDIFTAVVAVQS